MILFCLILKKNKIVISDRYIHSSLVYQGYVRDLGIKEVFNINKFAIQNVLPDIVILIMLEPEKCFERIRQNSRDMNRLDRESMQMHKKVYKCYQKLAKQYPDIIYTIDGSKTIKEVVDEVVTILKKNIKL